jgi:hypothetical protein
MATVDHSKPSHPPRFDHRILDLTGQRFERLLVVRFAGRTAKDLIVWECLCDCGKTCFHTSNGLRSKVERSRRRSCGCLGPDVTRERSTTHGKTRTPEYHTWRSMIERCENPNATGFDRYGGRGITICDRWRKSFESFLEDVGERPEKDMQLDRIDNDGNYEPGNCRWATMKEQANNRRKRKPRLTIAFNGHEKTIPQWAEFLGISVSTIYLRRWKRLPVDQVLSASRDVS